MAKTFCIIPMSSTFHININSLQDEDKHLLSSAISQPNLNEIALIIKKLPLKVLPQLKSSYKKFNLQETDLMIPLDISSDIFLFNGTLKYHDFSYNFKTLIKQENEFNYRILDRFK